MPLDNTNSSSLYLKNKMGVHNYLASVSKSNKNDRQSCSHKLVMSIKRGKNKLLTKKR